MNKPQNSLLMKYPPSPPHLNLSVSTLWKKMLFSSFMPVRLEENDLNREYYPLKWNWNKKEYSNIKIELRDHFHRLSLWSNILLVDIHSFLHIFNVQFLNVASNFFCGFKFLELYSMSFI